MSLALGGPHHPLDSSTVPLLLRTAHLDVTNHPHRIPIPVIRNPLSKDQGGTWPACICTCAPGASDKSTQKGTPMCRSTDDFRGRHSTQPCFEEEAVYFCFEPSVVAAGRPRLNGCGEAMWTLILAKLSSSGNSNVQADQAPSVKRCCNEAQDPNRGAEERREQK